MKAKNKTKITGLAGSRRMTGNLARTHIVHVIDIFVVWRTQLVNMKPALPVMAQQKQVFCRPCLVCPLCTDGLSHVSVVGVVGVHLCRAAV